MKDMSNNGYDPLEILSIKDVALILKRTEVTVRQYVKKYNIPHIKHRTGYKGSKQIYITRQDLTKFIYGYFNNA